MHWSAFDIVNETLSKCDRSVSRMWATLAFFLFLACPSSLVPQIVPFPLAQS
jgi:hypothetical protein